MMHNKLTATLRQEVLSQDWYISSQHPHLSLVVDRQQDLRYVLTQKEQEACNRATD